ncbi:MAG: mechanosensitive ion channel family protein [Planctomycetaceae bacterium]|nr:mechanosensitive ion channel family protein [Planctomycetaceae bacterium]
MWQSVVDWWQATVDPMIDRVLPEREFLGNNVERWLVAIGVFLGLWALFRIIKSIVRRRAKTLAERSESIAPWAKAVEDVATATKLWFLFGLAFYLSSLILALPDRALVVVRSLAAIVLILQAAIWGNKLIEFAITRYSKENRVEDAASVTTMSALAFLGKLAIWSIAFLLVLDNLGVDVTALIAGLGVGGIAVALAAQNVLGDLFASLSIVMDKPFVLGDFIIVGDFMGTVENIGMKTTRLRSLSGEQLVFPNSDLLGSRIRNFKRMQERRVVFGIGVTYETALSKVQKIPELIKQAITSQEQARFDRAHFKAFGDSALTYEAVYYVTTADYNIYMDIQQQINFQLLEQFESQGIEFAYPTQTIHLQQASQNPAVSG